MDRAFNGQSILNEHFQLISLVNFDQWAGLLAIDEVHLARDTVWSPRSAVDSEVVRAQSSIR